MKRAKTVLPVIALCLALVCNVAACGPKVSLTLAAETIGLHVGESAVISVTADPADVSVTYESDDQTIATVGEDGSVLANKAGTTTVRVLAGRTVATCTVEVTDTRLLAPERRVYYAGAATPDLIGGRIEITKPDNTKAYVSLSAGSVTLKTFDTSAVGETQAVVAYDGRDYAWPITVKAVAFGADTMKDADYFASFPIDQADGTAAVTERGVTMTKSGSYGLIKFPVFAPADTYAVAVAVSSETDGQTFEFRFEDDAITDNADRRPKYISKYYKGDQAPPLHAEGGDRGAAKKGRFTGAFRFETEGNVEGDLGWNANNAPFLEKLRSGAATTMAFSYEGADGDFIVEEVYFLNQSEFETATAVALIPPVKRTYVVGEPLDLTGGTLTLTNVFGKAFKTLPLTDQGVAVTGFDASQAAAPQTVTVTYGAFSKTFTVEIREGYKSVTLNAPTEGNYRGAVRPYLKSGSFTCVTGAGETQTVPLSDERVIVKSFDSTAVGMPAENNVVLTFGGVDYGYKTEILDRAATAQNNIINDVYLTNFDAFSGNNASVIVEEGKLVFDFDQGKTWGSANLMVTAPADAYAVHIKVSSETDGKTFNLYFRDETITTANDKTPKYAASWYKGADPVPALHAKNDKHAEAKAGAFTGNFLLMTSDNTEGPLGWNANNQPFVDKLRSGEPMQLQIGANGAMGAIVIEEFWFLTQAEYEAL